MKNEKIIIYTDGSCIGNPGPGGWGAIIRHGKEEIQISGGEIDTTNNRMEMMAIIQALKWVNSKSGLKKGEISETEIEVFSDSNLLMQSLNLGWKRKANLDLWEKMDLERGSLNITWTWVKAHSTNKYNNLVDRLAFTAAIKIQKAK
ncbi:MAG: ribonuclease HI [Candidatus Gracilibacteria bacterium]|nr:ribonuclease HI [Candidatus Gracilibacteria bacterium]